MRAGLRIEFFSLDEGQFKPPPFFLILKLMNYEIETIAIFIVTPITETKPYSEMLNEDGITFPITGNFV